MKEEEGIKDQVAKSPLIHQIPAKTTRRRQSFQISEAKRCVLRKEAMSSKLIVEGVDTTMQGLAEGKI